MQAENEFRATLKQVSENLRTYLYAHYGFHQKQSSHAINELLISELVIIGIPRDLALGGVHRDAVNFKSLKLILFNSESWKKMNQLQRTRLAVVEGLGLAGFGSEEERYRETAFVMNALVKVAEDGDNYSNKCVFIYNPNQQELERFSGNRFFLNESYPKDDYTGYLMMNPDNPIFNPGACRKEATPANFNPNSMFHRMIHGATLVDPLMINYCTSLINRGSTIPLRFIYSKETHVIEYCKPEFQ